MRKDLDEELDVTSRLFYWTTIATIIALALACVAYKTRPTFLGFEHNAFVASHQYVEARRIELSNLAAEYERISVEIIRLDGAAPDIDVALRGQRDALRQRMIVAADSIDPEDVPESARTILNRSR